MLTRRAFLTSLSLGAVASCTASAPRTTNTTNNIMERYQAGINLGTWISQYRNQKPPEFDTRVREHDVAQIASWGADHIRLPIDNDFFEDPGKPSEYREDRLAYADRAVAWAGKNKLNVILDLHRAPGYFFGDVGSNRLFTEDEMQQRFLAIWRMFAGRYRSERENLMFELLNEVVEATPAEWGRLVRRAVAEIRAVDPDRWIVVGGTQYNSINSLKDIEILDEPRIVYTFHYYLPMPFTHQKAGWVKPAMEYDRFTGGQRVDYPGEVPRLREFGEAHPQSKWFASLAGIDLNRDWMRGTVQPAVDFLKKTGKPLYCGEYGVIRHASEQSKERWYEDFTSFMREHRIGRAAWSYKDGAFPLVDRDTSKPVNTRVIQLASRKW